MVAVTESPIDNAENPTWLKSWRNRSGTAESDPNDPNGSNGPASSLPAFLGADGKLPKAQPLSGVEETDGVRFSSGYSELDRVLGGGFVPGGYILLGGDPGIGKSTLMLQVAHAVAQQGQSVLYVAGEESPHQIKQRASRLGVIGDPIDLLADIDIRNIMAEITRTKPDFVIIDSIQSVADGSQNNPPGSISQVKNCATQLMGLAKSLNVTILLIGHVTKEGGVGGPKLLEHTVDTVLFFEGEKYKDLRILRTLKNRFGSTQEIGVFEMDAEGLQEVTNPSGLFLEGPEAGAQPGSVVICPVEGTRPVLVELQALVGYSAYATPRRIGTGVHTNRMHQVVAVLERRLGLNFAHQDLYINVVGGLSVDEPAADLGMALALTTSLRNVAVLPNTVVVGEIGLTGEIRPVRQWKIRLQEAKKLGFQRIVLPAVHLESMDPEWANGIEVIGVRTLMDAVSQCVMPLDESSTPAPDFGPMAPMSPVAPGNSSGVGEAYGNSNGEELPTRHLDAPF